MYSKLKVLFFFICLFIAQFVNADTDHNHQATNLKYVPNAGQWESNVVYKAQIGNGSLFLEKDAFTFSLVNGEDLHEAHELIHNDVQAGMNYTIHNHAYKVNLLNANPNVYLESMDELPTSLNYFLGSDNSKWGSDIHAATIVKYNAIFAGIDAFVYSQNGDLKYDFIVQPNANVNQIALNYEGLDAIGINEKGDLMLTTSLGEFSELKPYAYQLINGAEAKVKCNYILDGEQVRFEFPNGFDHTKELVIDPILVGATLSGSSAENYGHSAAFDDQGNIYTAARNFGIGYPTTLGAFQTTYGGNTDIVISKLDPTASTLIYATYLGGSDQDLPHSLFVNNGELYMLGSTESIDYPVSALAAQVNNGGQTDIVVTHFNQTGTALIGSTYMGGTLDDGSNSISYNYGDDFRGEIIVESNGDCAIACYSSSTNFPTTTGAYQTSLGGDQDAVVFKLSPDMSTILMSTFMGAAGDDVAYGLRALSNGDLYVTGSFASNAINLSSGYQVNHTGDDDAYVVRISADGSTIMNGTYLGTADKEQGFFLDLDPSGDVYIFGQTHGANLPITSGAYNISGSTQFLSKFDPSLSNLMISTLVGGTGGSTWTLGSVSGLMAPTAFMVDRCGYIYMSGFNTDQNLPLTAGAFHTSGSFYVSVLQPDAAGLHFSTYYGGSADHVDGGTSRFDPRGVVYQAVCSNSGFQTTAGAHSSTYPSADYDIGVFKINFELQTLQADFSTSFVGGNACAPATVNFTNLSTGIYHTWDFGDGSPLDTAFQPTHVYNNAGVYNVMLVTTDSTACSINDTIIKQITIGGIASTVTANSMQITSPVPCQNVPEGTLAL
jgi:hypothetical protein